MNGEKIGNKYKMDKVSLLGENANREFKSLLVSFKILGINRPNKSRIKEATSFFRAGRYNEVRNNIKKNFLNLIKYIIGTSVAENADITKYVKMEYS
jgi:hypothetical protein